MVRMRIVLKFILKKEDEKVLDLIHLADDGV